MTHDDNPLYHLSTQITGLEWKLEQAFKPLGEAGKAQLAEASRLLLAASEIVGKAGTEVMKQAA